MSIRDRVWSAVKSALQTLIELAEVVIDALPISDSNGGGDCNE